MPVLYFDTSALVRRYDEGEPGAGRVRELCEARQDEPILTARLTTVEIASALNRKVRERTLSPDDRDFAWRLFEVHQREDYRLIELDPYVVLTAERLPFVHPLRAYDAVQIASALRASALLAGRGSGFTFCTADQRQAQAAAGEGLQVELIA